MKVKIGALFIVLAILIFFEIVPSAEARPQFQGIDCGFADSTSGADRCCYNETYSIARIPGEWWLQYVPIIGSRVKRYNRIRDNFDSAQEDVLNSMPCMIGDPDRDPSDQACKCVVQEDDTRFRNISIVKHVSSLCENSNFKNSDEMFKCVKCAQDVKGYWSGFGCIPLNIEGFIKEYVFKIGISFAGIIALICIIYSAIKIQLSRGNAELIQASRERLTSCIIGLILIVFSVFILRVIGVDILGLPGFGS